MNIEATITSHETLIRASIFIGLFIVFTVLERIIPRREFSLNVLKHWLANFSVFVINSALLKFLLPFPLLAVAAYAAQNNLGLLNTLSLPNLITVVVGIILLDLAIYWQHRLFHRVPLFWRVHKVHHADLDFNVTTGLRFHPLEMFLSILIKALIIIALGIPVIAVLIFEVLLNAASLFSHSNIRLPKKLDTFLRYLVVTPDMHRIHHSNIVDETNSNYGFCLTLWDRLFTSYTHTAKHGQSGIVFGLESLNQEQDTNTLLGILKIPFKG